MKTKFQRLALAALLLSGSGVAAAEDNAASAVGDMPGYGEAAYFHQDATYIGDSFVGDDTTIPKASAAPTASIVTRAATEYAPVSAEQLQTASFLGDAMQSSCDGSCDGDCDGGCDSGCSSGMKVCDIFDRVDSATWAETEFLMWFVQDRQLPPLVTSSDPGTAPVLPNPALGPNPDGVQVLFGDETDGELSAGFRGDYGRWITDRVGIGGRFWILTENEDDFAASGNGTGRSIGRPFFDVNLPGEQAININNDGTGPSINQFAGSVAARNTIDIWAGEAYSRFRFPCSGKSHVELIGGYTHFEIDDDLAITSTSIAAASGETTTFSDRFQIDNTFDGGQIGFESIIRRGKWSVRSLTKVHLGNMEQRYRIAGTTLTQTPPAAPTTDAPIGFLARNNNSGSFERDVFAFIPEANFKLAYQLRRNTAFTVGYSFVYFDNVALTGDVLDRVISDGSQLQTGGATARPDFNFADSSLWVQGIDLGLAINY